jgi:hypothetical protein
LGTSKEKRREWRPTQRPEPQSSGFAAPPVGSVRGRCSARVRRAPHRPPRPAHVDYGYRGATDRPALPEGDAPPSRGCPFGLFAFSNVCCYLLLPSPLSPTGESKASRRRAEEEQRGGLGDGFGDEMVALHPETPGSYFSSRGVCIQSEVRDTETIEMPQRMGLSSSESTVEPHRLVRLGGVDDESKIERLPLIVITRVFRTRRLHVMLKEPCRY